MLTEGSTLIFESDTVRITNQHLGAGTQAPPTVSSSTAAAAAGASAAASAAAARAAAAVASTASANADADTEMAGSDDGTDTESFGEGSASVSVSGSAAESADSCCVEPFPLDGVSIWALREFAVEFSKEIRGALGGQSDG